MAAAVKTSGAQAATVTTEHTLATVTDAGVYQLAIDVSDLANGATPDILEVRIYGKVRSSDTERLILVRTIGPGDQTEDQWMSPPFISPHHYRASITQTQGTGRTFEWAIYNA
jgi:hypothetical protein